MINVLEVNFGGEYMPSELGAQEWLILDFLSSIESLHTLGKSVSFARLFI